MIDLEAELRLAMHESTEHLQADPGLLTRLPQPRRRSRSFALLATAASVAAVAGVGAYAAGQFAGTTHHERGRLGQGQPTDRNTSVESLFGSWGPTRGARAHDASYLRRLEQEWAAPQGRGAVAGFTPLDNAQGGLRVLWAGSTPAGPAAVAAQDESQAPGQSDVVIGIFIPGPGGAPRLVQRQNLIGGFQDSPRSGVPDPDGFVFAPDPAGRYVVVVPADLTATVKISAAHTDQAGRMVRPYVGAVVRDGSAQLDFGVRHVAGDEVVEVVSGGKTVVSTPVIATLAPQPSEPDNLVGEWGVNGLFIGGSKVDGFGEDEDTSAWLQQRGASPAQPIRNAPWGGPIAATKEGGRVFAEQLWLPGELAHTLVVQEAAGDGDDQPWGKPVIVSDEVTDPTTRPLFAVRLPRGQGWFVGSGPGVTLKAWRERGGTWTPLRVPAALLDSTDASLELELSDGSRTVLGG